MSPATNVSPEVTRDSSESQGHACAYDPTAPYCGAAPLWMCHALGLYKICERGNPDDDPFFP